MKHFYKFLGISCLLLIISSCEKEHYTPIVTTNELAISVNLKDSSVSFIDILQKKRIAHWNFNESYSGGLMLPDGEHLLLYGKQVEHADIYSLKKGEKVSSWKLGTGIVNAVLMNNKKEIAFADQDLHSVRFFTLKGEEIGHVKSDKGPLTLLNNRSGTALYSISYQSNTLNVIDSINKKSIKSFPIHSQATGGLVRENEKEIWIGGHGEGEVMEQNIHVYDSDTGKLLRCIHAPVMPINFFELDDAIYVLSHGSSTLYKLDQNGFELTSTTVGSNPFEIRTVHDDVVIAGYDSNEIYFLDKDSLKQKWSVEVGKGPYQLIIREDVEE